MSPLKYSTKVDNEYQEHRQMAAGSLISRSQLNTFLVFCVASAQSKVCWFGADDADECVGATHREYMPVGELVTAHLAPSSQMPADAPPTFFIVKHNRPLVTEH